MFAGGGLALFIAQPLLTVLLELIGGTATLSADASLDGRALAYTAAICTLTAGKSEDDPVIPSPPARLIADLI